MSKEKKDLLQSFELIETLLKNFHEGERMVYLSMAVELRKLLCETNPSPLITRVIPNFKLHKLHITKKFENNPDLLKNLVAIMPGKLKTSKTKPTIFTLTFTPKLDEMELDDWVDQIFFKEEITIRELIRSVANKEGAHSDPKYNDTLLYCQNWTFKNVKCHILGIYSITRYLYELFNNEYLSDLQ